MRSETVVFGKFRGIQTSLNEPAPDSARDCRNLVRNRRLGALELGMTYDLKFPDDLASTLPQTVELEQSNYFDPAVYKISNLVFENIHNFYVPDHGGQNITVAIGTYRKTGFFPGNPTLDRSGLFVRPWWDGGQWVDSWRELTEMFIFELTSLGAAGTTSSETVAFTDIMVDTTVGSTTWTNPNNALADGGSVTSAPITGIGETHRLVATGAAPTIPAGKRLTGIELKIDRKTSIGNRRWRFERVEILKNGTPIGSVKLGSMGWTNSETTETLGGTLDAWGIEISPGDILGARFTVRSYEYDDLATTWSAQIDYARFELHYDSTSHARLYIDEGPGDYNFQAADPDAVVFNAEYFRGWTICYEGFSDSENYDLVRACGYDGTKYFLELYHANTDFASRVAGTKLLVYRNFLTAEMPATIVSYCHNVLNEMRLTTGNQPDDVVLMGGMRQKSVTHYADLSMDELIVAHAQGEAWPSAVFLAITGVTTADDAGMRGGELAAGTYQFRYALVTDTGARGRLYEAGTLTGGNYLAGASVAVAEGEVVTLEAYRSLGAFPKNARGIAVYMSDDGGQYFYKVAELDFLTAGLLDAPAVGGPAGVDHLYLRVPLVVTGFEWNADIPEAQVDVGRSITDAGVIRYTQAAVIGANAYAVGVYANGQAQPNRVYSSSINGDGVSQYDIFPDDPVHALSVEYNDADAALAVIGLNNRFAAAKKRSLLLMRFDPSAGYVRDVVTKGWGIASARTLAEFDGDLYWLDYAGVMKFNEGGIQIINREWLQDLLALPDVVKEAAIATFDRNEKLYLLRLNGLVYIYDLLSGEWMIDDYNDTPERFAIDNSRNRIDFLANGNIYTLREGIIHVGGHYPFYYESNEIDRPGPEPVDLNLLKVFLRYRSTIDFQLTLFKDDTGEIIAGPVTVSKDHYRAVLLVGREKLCTSFRWRIEGTAVDQFSAFRLQRIGFVYQPIEIAGETVS